MKILSKKIVHIVCGFCKSYEGSTWRSLRPREGKDTFPGSRSCKQWSCIQCYWVGDLGQFPLPSVSGMKTWLTAGLTEVRAIKLSPCSGWLLFPYEWQSQVLVTPCHWWAVCGSSTQGGPGPDVLLRDWKTCILYPIASWNLSVRGRACFSWPPSEPSPGY